MAKVDSLADWGNLLNGNGCSWSQSEDGKRIVAVCSVGQRQAQLYLSQAPEMLHLQLFLPGRVPHEAIASAALVMARINSALNVPGFCLDPDLGLIEFRVTLPALPDGIPGETALALLATCIVTAEEHWKELLLELPDEPDTALGGENRLDAFHPAFGGGIHPAGYDASAIPVFSEREMEYTSGSGGPSHILMRGRRRASTKEQLFLPGAAGRRNLVSHEAGQATIWDEETGQVLGVLEAGERLSVHVPLGNLWIEEDSGAFRRRLSEYGKPLTASCNLGPESRALQAQLETMGFAAGFDEVIVHRRLDDPLPHFREPWRWSTPKAPEEKPLQLLERAMLDLPAAADLKVKAGDFLQLPLEQWRLGNLGGTIMGLALLSRTADQSGGFDFIGLFPEFRRRGLGGQFHAAALAELRRSGVRDYWDATHIQNKAMQRIFFLNGCRLAAILRCLRRIG